MKPKTTCKQTILTLFLFTLCTTFYAQIIVDNNINVNAQYSDLQTAIDAANANDIIYIHQSGTSYDGITINKPLTLIGRSHSDNAYKTTFKHYKHYAFRLWNNNTWVKFRKCQYNTSSRIAFYSGK